MAGYNATLKDGREIFIPSWPVDVALENLTRAGQYIGSEAIITISELNVAAVVVAIMKSTDPNKTASLIKHFVCQVRIAGSKIEPNQIDEMFTGGEGLGQVAEIFAHVIKAQYADFFAFGLAGEPSQEV